MTGKWEEERLVSSEIVGMSTAFKQIILSDILSEEKTIVVDPEKECEDLQKSGCKNKTIIKWKGGV